MKDEFHAGMLVLDAVVSPDSVAALIVSMPTAVVASKLVLNTRVGLSSVAVAVAAVVIAVVVMAVLFSMLGNRTSPPRGDSASTMEMSRALLVVAAVTAALRAIPCEKLLLLVVVVLMVGMLPASLSPASCIIYPQMAKLRAEWDEGEGDREGRKFQLLKLLLIETK